MKGDSEHDTSFDFWLDEAEHPFSGWDFSHISASGRMVTAPLSWSYTSELLPTLRLIRALLDMGTGGGEFLAGLQPLPPHTCATEGYPPNIPIAQQRLKRLGAAQFVSGAPLQEHLESAYEAIARKAAEMAFGEEPVAVD